MTNDKLCERYEPPYRLPVRLSDALSRVIESVMQHNLSNGKYERWYNEHLLHMLRIISTPSVAFDYANQSEHLEDGTIIGYGFEYSLENDEQTQSTYVYILNMDLELDEYGLTDNIIPEAKNRKHIILTESKLRRIIRESIYHVLRG